MTRAHNGLLVAPTRLTFSDAKCELRGVANAERLDLIASLLRRHPTLVAHVEGHTGVNAPARAAPGFSMQRAQHVGVALASRGVDAATRVRMRGWGQSVARAAEWPQGPASRRVDVFFTFGPAWEGGADPACERAHGAARATSSAAASPTIFLPPRPDYYGRVERFAASARAHYAGERPLDACPQLVPADQFFYDAVAQALLADPRLQAVFEALHGQPPARRPALVAEAVAADETGELGRLFARLHECAGDAVSMQRAAPSFEERRVEIHVRGDHAAALHE